MVSRRRWIESSRTHLDERVDGHNRHVRLRLGVVHQVQVDQLLQLQIVGLHAVDHVREQGRHVLAHRHAGNDLKSEKPGVKNCVINAIVCQNFGKTIVANSWHSAQNTHFLDSLLFLLLLVIVQFGFQLEDLTLLGGGEVFGVRHALCVERS
jgi:hypothetical protein